MGGRLVESDGESILYFSTDNDCKNILASLAHFSEEVLSLSYISGSTVNHFYSTQGRMTLNRLGEGWGGKYHIVANKTESKNPLIKKTDCASNKFSSD